MSPILLKILKQIALLKLNQKRISMQINPRLFGLIIFAFAGSAAAQEQAKERMNQSDNKLYQSMMIGGSLSTCSSFSKQHCKRGSFPIDAKSTTLYEINANSINRLELFIHKSTSKNAFSELLAIVEKLKGVLSVNTLTRDALFKLFEEAQISEQVKSLNDPAYYALLDHLEYAQVDDMGKRKKEVADVNRSRLSSSVHIYSSFVEQVQLRAAVANQEPHILVVTASSRDAFEVADFYTSVFTSLSVKTTWLPIDAGFSDAMEAKKTIKDACLNLDYYQGQHHLYDRKRIYPSYSHEQYKMCEDVERLTALIDSAQGIFINGGDQSKTLASITHNNGQFTHYWQHILARVNRAEMIVAGTSAGAAVQSGNSYAARPIPMISNGTSAKGISRGAFASMAPSQRCDTDNCEQAIGADDLTYMPTGGSGLFSVGTVDTHFSERDREGRLIALAGATDLRLAIGVDEATALLFSRRDQQIDFKILGENGVFFVDGYNAVQQKTITQGVRSSQYLGFSHYLTSGVIATLNLENNDWDISNALLAVEERKTLPLLEKGVWRNSTRKYCGTKEPISWQLQGVEYVLAPAQETRFFVDKKRKYCGYLFLPFVVKSEM